MDSFKEKVAKLLAEHETFLSQKNVPTEGGNGVATR